MIVEFNGSRVMRSSFVRVLIPAFASLLFFAAPTIVLADDDGSDGTAQSDGQDTVSDVPDAPAPGAKILHSIPEDGMPIQGATGPYNKQIRDLVAARPGEDLVICVAGCFSGRDRVVYAQPVEAKPAAPKVSAAKPADPAKTAAALPAPAAAKPAPKPATASTDPKTPVIINAQPGNSGSHESAEPAAHSSSK